MRKGWGWRSIGIVILSASMVSTGKVAAEAGSVSSSAGNPAIEALSRQLRTFVLDVLPDPLYEDTKKWGMQKQNRKGQWKNDGRWLKYRITGRNLADNLKLQIEEVKKEGARSTFKIQIHFDAHLHLDRQTWNMGRRFYSGSTRARFRAFLTLNCELITRVAQSKVWLPDMIVRFRVLDSVFHHDHLVVEHTAGVGGDLAKVLGELMVGIIKVAKPDLERRLHEKINAAIVKAGDTKEVRLSLADVLSGKALLPAKKAATKK